MNDKAKIAALTKALEDMYNGWRYIRQSHGDLYGVGWDRAEFKARDALALTADASEQAPDAKVIAKVVSAYGDPEAFGERELIAIADLSTIPYGTNLYAAPASPVADTGAVTGWKMVPKELDAEMLRIGWLMLARVDHVDHEYLRAIWRSLLLAAPANPTATADSAADAQGNQDA